MNIKKGLFIMALIGGVALFIFYSKQLVWKIYKDTLDIEIGQLQVLKTFDL